MHDVSAHRAQLRFIIIGFKVFPSLHITPKSKKRNDELKQKHNGLQEDFKYNLQLVRERDDELDKLEEEIKKKNEVIKSLSISLQNYKQKAQSEKALNTKHQQLLCKSQEDVEIMKKEQEIKLNDLKFECSQKIESIEKQNAQQNKQIHQLRELVDRLKSQNEVTHDL